MEAGRRQLSTCPDAKSSRPPTAAITQSATSFGWPNRRIGVTPPAISFSYFSFTPAVISVRMMPGRTSKTGIPYSARRSANSFVTIEMPALLIQYSPRLVDEVYADIDAIFTIRGV